MSAWQPIYASATPIKEGRAGDWTCWRCGHQHVDSKPNMSGLCGSCRSTTKLPAKQALTRQLPSGVEGLEQPCRAWLRDFDDLDHPITPDGTLVAPGTRLCRHSDCVESTHILDPDE